MLINTLLNSYSRIGLLLPLCISLSFALPRSAHSEVPPMYVVDMQRVVEQSVIGKAAKNDIDSEIKKAKTKLSVTQIELEKLKETITKQTSLLSPDALEQKREAFQAKERDYVRQAKDIEEDLRRKGALRIEKIVEKAESAIAKLSEKENYPIVIERGARLVIYVDPKFDITADVIKALDAEKLS